MNSFDFLKKYSFGFLVLIAAFINLPLFLNKIPLYHDTLAYYISFFNTYNSFFFHGELPRWLPFTGFGVQNDFIQLTLVTAVDYFYILIGCLFRIENAFFLYKASIFTTQLIYLLGVYTLAKDIFENDSSVWLVCLCSISSIVLKDQIYWSFLSFYLLPWMLFYFKKFLNGENLCHFLFVSIISLLGSVTYYVAIVFLQFFVFLIFYLSLERVNFIKRLDKFSSHFSFRNIINLSLIFFLAVAYLYICFFSREHVQLLSEGRDLSTYEIPINFFLGYGGHAHLTKFKFFFIPSHLNFLWSDLNIYMGLTIWICVLYGIVRNKKSLFFSFLAISVVIFFFSSGTPLSVFSYYFVPGMKYFRHIGLTANLLRFYVPFLAGFGLQSILYDVRHQKSSFLHYLIFSFCIVALIISFYLSRSFLNVFLQILYFFVVLIVIGFSFFFSFVQRSKKPHLGILFALLCFFELLVVRTLIIQRFEKYADHQPRSFSFVTSDFFNRYRTFYPLDKRASEIVRYVLSVQSSLDSSIYGFYYDFFKWDPCFPDIFRIDYINKYVYNFLLSLGETPTLKNFSLSSNFNNLQILGCRSSKIKLISQVLFSDNPHELSMISQKENVIVLSNVTSEVQENWKNYNDPKGAVDVINFSPNRLSVKAFVPDSKGAWLYYKDGYHPQWKATVNGQNAVVYQANIGFKAIKLEQGQSIVDWYFDSWQLTWCFYVLIIASLLFALNMLTNILKEVSNPDL